MKLGQLILLIFEIIFLSCTFMHSQYPLPPGLKVRGSGRVIGRRQGDTLDKSPVHCRDTWKGKQRQTTIRIRAHTLAYRQFRGPNSPRMRLFRWREEAGERTHTDTQKNMKTAHGKVPKYLNVENSCAHTQHLIN